MYLIHLFFSFLTQLKQQRLYDDQSSLRLILLGNLNFNMSLLCLCVLNSSTSEQAKNVRQMVLGRAHNHLTFFWNFPVWYYFVKETISNWGVSLDVLNSCNRDSNFYWIRPCLLNFERYVDFSLGYEFIYHIFFDNVGNSIELNSMRYKAVWTCLYQVMDKISTSNW